MGLCTLPFSFLTAAPITYRGTRFDHAGIVTGRRKIVRLLPGNPELEVSHSLKNIGSKPIETSQYSHNFFAMDHQVVGPDVSVRFAFTPVASRDMKYGTRLEDHAIVYTRELED